MGLLNIKCRYTNTCKIIIRNISLQLYDIVFLEVSKQLKISEKLVSSACWWVPYSKVIRVVEHKLSLNTVSGLKLLQFTHLVYMNNVLIQEAQVTIECVVPQKHHGSIMGPRGQRVQDISKSFSVSIKIPERTVDGESLSAVNWDLLMIRIGQHYFLFMP